MKNQDVLYQVKVTQDIPYWSGDEEFSFCESSGVTEEYVAGSFQSEEFARIFAEALKGKIAAGCDYAMDAFTPMVSVVMVTRSYKELEG